MAKVTPPAPQPFHPPVGTSDEAYPTTKRWFALGVIVLIVLVASLLVLLRP